MYGCLQALCRGAGTFAPRSQASSVFSCLNHASEDIVIPLETSALTPCWRQECEPAVGRLLVFSVEGQGAERKVNLVAEVETRGAVYVLNGFNGKLLAGINSKVCGLLLLTVSIYI